MSFESLIERRAQPEPNSGCLLWLGYVTPKGYGSLKFNGHMRLAHRVAYEMTKGPIKKPLHIDHLCRVRCCVNPIHLEAVTIGENNRRSDLRNNGKRRRQP
jgi:hypothetical protein